MGPASVYSVYKGRMQSFDDLTTLPDDVVRDYQEAGHAVVRGLATREEIARYRPAIVGAAEKARFEKRPLQERDTYGKAFLQLFNLWRLDEEVRAFVFARRFAAVAARLMEVDGVRLYHDQGLFKEPGGGTTPWHQDQFYWPLDTDRTITMWMPLVDVDPSMGPMRFASGSHTARSLGDFPIGDVSHEEFGAIVERRGLPVRDHAPFAAGDATFHSGWTLHSAAPNRTDTMREVMTIIYYADGTRVGELDHPARKFDRDVWLAGCEPGELAAGPLNPVLYERGGNA